MLKYFFFQKAGFDISCKSYNLICFSAKNKKHVTSLSFAKLAQRLVEVKDNRRSKAKTILTVSPSSEEEGDTVKIVFALLLKEVYSNKKTLAHLCKVSVLKMKFLA